MTTPAFGMTFSRDSDDTVSALGADFSKALIIETSEDASAETYPLDTPVRISTSDSDAVDALGSGLLAAYVQGINDQLTDLNEGADVTIVRVSEGEDTATTAAAIVDIVNSLSSIPSEVNATPRIVMAGRTAWRADLDTTNPVVAALESNLGNIMAIAPVDVDDTSSANAIDARETMSSERLMPIGVAARVYEGSDLVTRPMSPRVAGLMMRIDNNQDGLPFDPFANQAIYGLAGLSRKIPFNLLDGSIEGQQMLAANVSIVVAGETGVDGAVADGGYVFIGTDNAQSNDTTWEQIHQVRGTDYIVTQLMEITRQYLGLKLTATAAENWINSIGNALRDHKAADRIIGYTPKAEMFTADKNSTSNIKLGKLHLDIGIEPAPVFKVAEHEIMRYANAIDDLVANIVASLSSSD